MKLMYICLFLTFVATLVYGDDQGTRAFRDDVHDCVSEGAEIRRLKDMITKVSNKHNGEYELEFLNWFLDLTISQIYFF